MTADRACGGEAGESSEDPIRRHSEVTRPILARPSLSSCQSGSFCDSAVVSCGQGDAGSACSLSAFAVT
eukprot:748319-Hanusia_phi.AAC.11